MPNLKQRYIPRWVGKIPIFTSDTRSKSNQTGDCGKTSWDCEEVKRWGKTCVELDFENCSRFLYYKGNEDH